MKKYRAEYRSTDCLGRLGKGLIEESLFLVGFADEFVKELNTTGQYYKKHLQCLQNVENFTQDMLGTWWKLKR